MIDKSGWKLVRFGDIVVNLNQTTKHFPDEEFEIIIGLDHIDSENLHLTRWNINGDSTSFTKVFHKGQTLYGKRRAYQKKVAIAEFDGICSGDILVFDSKDEYVLLSQLIPFICMSESFYKYVESNSQGSLSPRVSFTALAKYEFLLPPLEEQKRIAELLWVADEVVYKERDVLEAINRVEAICQGEIFSGRFPTITIGDEFEVQLGKMLSPKSKAENSNGELPYLGNFNVQWNRFALDNVNTMLFSEKEQAKFELRNGDLLVCEGGEVGRCAIWNGEIKPCYYQKALHRLRAKKGYSPYLLMQYMIWASGNGLLKKLTGHSTIAHLPAEKLRQVQIPRLTKAEILKYESLFNQIDGVRYKCIANIEGKKDVLGNMVSYYIGGAN